MNIVLNNDEGFLAFKQNIHFFLSLTFLFPDSTTAF